MAFFYLISFILCFSDCLLCMQKSQKCVWERERERLELSVNGCCCERICFRLLTQTLKIESLKAHFSCRCALYSHHLIPCDGKTLYPQCICIWLVCTSANLKISTIEYQLHCINDKCRSWKIETPCRCMLDSRCVIRKDVEQFSVIVECLKVKIKWKFYGKIAQSPLPRPSTK